MRSGLQAVLYLRVSETRGGRSIEDQEREGRAECADNDWPVRAVFCDDGISASRYGKTRPDWEKTKRALRADDVLVVWEASRTGRDLKEFVILRDICAKVGAVLSYNGRVYDMSDGQDRHDAAQDAVRSEYESELLSKRVLRGKRSGAREGRPAGRVKWGYRVVSPGVWELDPVEAPKVTESVKRILRGDTVYSVLLWLATQEGYQPPTITVLNRALKSPTYAALRVHKGEVIGPGNWPALITEEEHRELVARTRPRVGPPASPEPRHLLSGIAKCGKPGCGRGVRYRKNRHGTPIYNCTKGHVSRLANPLDARVAQELFDQLRAVDTKKYDDTESAIASAAAEIREKRKKLEAKKAEWLAAAKRNEVSLNAYIEVEKDADERIAELEAEEAAMGVSTPPDVDAILDNWNEDDLKTKRHVIRTFLTITIYPSAQGHKVGDGGVDIQSNVRTISREDLTLV